MRIFLLSSILLCCITLHVQAQDLILRTTGEELPARILGITLSEVKYVSSTGSPSADTLYITTNEVFLIRYANGTKVMLNTTAAAPKLTSNRTAAEMTNQGRMDAQKYFKAPGSLFVTATATAVSVTLLGPAMAGALGGIGTGAIIVASPIQNQNMIVPDTVLLNDANYLLGYQKQAQRKKLGKAAGGFGIGVVTGSVLWFAIVLSNTKHF